MADLRALVVWHHPGLSQINLEVLGLSGGADEVRRAA